MSISTPGHSPQQSRVPTYSGFFEIFIKIRGSEGRERRLVFFNHERSMFYVAEPGQNEAVFRGPSNALTVFAYVENGSLNGCIKFPPSESSKNYEFVESIFPAKRGSETVIEMAHTKVNLGILGAATHGSQKPIYHAPSTSPSYFPPTGQPPRFVGRG